MVNFAVAFLFLMQATRITDRVLDHLECPKARSARSTRIAKIDFRKSIFAVIGFQKSISAIRAIRVARVDVSAAFFQPRPRKFKSGFLGIGPDPVSSENFSTDSKRKGPHQKSSKVSRPILSTSDFQSEVFGEIDGELPAKFGRRFSSFFCWENCQKHFHQNSTANFTIKLHYEVLGCGGPYNFDIFRQFPRRTKSFKNRQASERAKGAEKASCGETVVQKGVFGESVSSLALKVCSLNTIGADIITQEALKGDILKGDIWKWDFALQFALENGISLCSSHSTRQCSLLFLREFHREGAV